MITKFHIFESNDDKKLYYHATKFDHLPYILEEGLTPNIDRNVNWSGLEVWSRNKVFVTDTITKALDYGQLINKNEYFPILRILLDPRTLKKDHFNDFYSTEPITGNFEVKTSNTDNEWENLKDYVRDLEEVEESISEK
jgi:hypothetical protein